ncbi:unnamed protein product (macronuclear) [Paramecium tetraurelia]|uniref:Transmembrane protein n=1 Tax=Paramecium tetraurelia TaxID=5888 RepID=A0CHR5_PARTE|nr:uncharacterized protein GSPATT00038434001 [Paramecium tetraurelia]CAK70332.1 unnamed protein product [Paramecium tetraurelia]|eukprot:XP_001437729.1 hypothetical protein (macronuclear) [Paramecium tetraurelia strain d4-2]
MLYQILIIFLIQWCCQAGNFCSLYPYDSISCVQKIQDTQCQYNYDENKCIEFLQSDYGCRNNLNRKACIGQQTDQQKVEARCKLEVISLGLFIEKCIQVTNLQLKTLGCNLNFSKFSCLNVLNQDCMWQEYCQEFNPNNVNQLYSSCEQYYNDAVSPRMCARIEKFQCFHGGIQQDYHCITLLENELSEIQCSHQGLNKNGCISITTKDQTCIYNSQQKCKFTDVSLLDSCDNILNKHACLSSKINNLQCEWTVEGCRIFQNDNQECNQIVNVNYLVCENYDGICSYNIETQSCEEVTQSQLNNLSCSEIGLSKKACLLIKNTNCTFYRGFCENLSEEDLNTFGCDMLLNEEACINIKTQFQYCQWDGINCQRIFLNQVVNCEIKDNHKFKYNGLYCQNISNNNAACKYDDISKQCVPSSPEDDCNSRYLNFLGCLNITKYKQTCQWTINGCIYIVILPYKTTCESLGNANPNSCSQVIENEVSGCYYNKSNQRCQKVDQLQTQVQLLISLDCENKLLGLNRILCASIIKPQTACRWYQNECVKIFNPKELSDVSCQEMIYSNSKSCAMIQFKSEPCRFENAAKGCVNSVKQIMKCDTSGLNAFACAQLEDQCYFNQATIECQLFKSQIPSQNSSQESESNNNQISINSLDDIECDKSSPTEKICKQISKPGQLCGWKETLDKCGQIIVNMNQKCTEFKNVNSNVCASVIMENPDYIPSNEKQKVGYCKYNSNNFSCDLLDGNELCETNCCTEGRFNGINQHSCSFLTKNSSSYCYFDNYRCKELTQNQVDIKNEEAVKQFYNANEVDGFKCSQMGKNSCHMIEWSTSQRCYFNGFSCVNINFENYKNYKIFTEAPSILNRFACLAIEASLTIFNIEKYFEYDPQNHRCISRNYQTSPPYYARCEDVQGNSNICLRFTENNYCKWDKKLLKCVTISLDEFADITTCDQNQNIKACKENIYSSCFFSFDLDRCITAYTYVPCNYFDSKGYVSQKSCSQIDLPNQQCEWQNYKCILTNKSSNKCDVIGTNKYTCYKNTQGNCRWSIENSTCYEIGSLKQIVELGCNDNLNYVLCKQVTKEPCMWDDSLYECVTFNQTPYSDFRDLNKNNLFNPLSCLQITGAGYTYDDKKNKCIFIENSNNQNSCFQMINQYACLYLTRGYNCVYDTTKMPPCQFFTDDQSVCTTSNLINIEVCMNISKQCYFSKSKLQCLVADIPQSQTCSSLGAQLYNGNHYNKLSCSSIDESIKQTYSEDKCFGSEDKKQKCNYENKCEWHNQIYGCQVKILNVLFFDKENTEKSSVYEYRYQIDNCTNYCNQFVKTPEVYSKTNKIIFPGTSAPLQCGLNKTCDYQDKLCQTDSDCPTIYKDPIKINDDGTLYLGIKQNQLCSKRCQKNGDMICNQQSDQNPQEIISDALIGHQSCQGRCNNSGYSSCYESFECGYTSVTDYITFQTSYYQNICQNKECTYSQVSCSNDQCPDYVSKSWTLKFAQCFEKTIYKVVPICKGFGYIELRCKNTFSKSLCLYGVLEECFFDLNQGGCQQLKGNENKIPNCSSISSRCKPTQNALQCDPKKQICKSSTECQPNSFLNSCLSSSNQKVICKAGQMKILPTQSQCFSLQRPIQICEPVTLTEDIYCDAITQDISPAYCALARDPCRFELNRCVSTIKKNQYNQCICDSSFSKSLCEECNCVFDFVGYCQQYPLAPQLRPDASNKYYLCHEVNQLNILSKSDCLYFG